MIKIVNILNQFIVLIEACKGIEINKIIIDNHAESKWIYI
jgi:hypothetical protein